MVEFIALISLVAGILQIILFFKVWGMTNDIRAIKKDHFDETVYEGYYEKALYVRKNLILGKKENVKAMLLKNFMDNLEQNYTREGDSIQPYVDNLKNQFSIFDEELPSYISNMKTFKDFHSLFTKADFDINK